MQGIWVNAIAHVRKSKLSSQAFHSKIDVRLYVAARLILVAKSKSIATIRIGER